MSKNKIPKFWKNETKKKPFSNITDNVDWDLFFDEIGNKKNYSFLASNGTGKTSIKKEIMKRQMPVMENNTNNIELNRAKNHLSSHRVAILDYEKNLQGKEKLISDVEFEINQLTSIVLPHWLQTPLVESSLSYKINDFSEFYENEKKLNENLINIGVSENEQYKTTISPNDSWNLKNLNCYSEKFAKIIGGGGGKWDFNPSCFILYKTNCFDFETVDLSNSSSFNRSLFNLSIYIEIFCSLFNILVKDFLEALMCPKKRNKIKELLIYLGARVELQNSLRIDDDGEEKKEKKEKKDDDGKSYLSIREALFKQIDLIRFDTIDYIDEQEKNNSPIMEEESDDYNFKESKYNNTNMFLIEIIRKMTNLSRDRRCNYLIKNLNCCISSNPNCNSEIIRDYNEYNSTLEKHWGECGKNLLSFFPDSILNIKFRKIIQASTGVELLEPIITSTKGKDYTLENFVTNIASQGEKRIVLFILFVLRKMTESKKSVIYVLDDAFLSLDNLNLQNMLLTFKDFVLDKNDSCFISLSHDYEVFRITNNIFLTSKERDSMFLLHRNPNEYKVKPLHFPVKNNIYTDYILDVRLKQSMKEKKHDSFFLCVIASLPHYRNYSELLNKNSNEYLNATNLMHFKSDKNYEDELQTYLNSDFLRNQLTEESHKSKLAEFTNNLKGFNYVDALKKTYSFAEDEANENMFGFEFNLFLSVFARVIVEESIFNQVKKYGNHEDLDCFNKTFELGKRKNILQNIVKGNKSFDDFFESIEKLNFFIPKLIHSQYYEVSYLLHVSPSRFSKELKIFMELIDRLK